MLKEINGFFDALNNLMIVSSERAEQSKAQLSECLIELIIVTNSLIHSCDERMTTGQSQPSNAITSTLEENMKEFKDLVKNIMKELGNDLFNESTVDPIADFLNSRQRTQESAKKAREAVEKILKALTAKAEAATATAAEKVARQEGSESPNGGSFCSAPGLVDDSDGASYTTQEATGIESCPLDRCFPDEEIMPPEQAQVEQASVATTGTKGAETNDEAARQEDSDSPPANQPTETESKKEEQPGPPGTSELGVQEDINYRYYLSLFPKTGDGELSDDEEKTPVGGIFPMDG